jgi:hypothetical protein
VPVLVLQALGRLCHAYGTKGHSVVERTVLVGYACDRHSNHQQSNFIDENGYSDSGYGSLSAQESSRQSSRRRRRWSILSSLCRLPWQSSALVRFEFEDWAVYLFSRRRRRWSILSILCGLPLQSSALVRFEFEDWAVYLFSFRGGTSSAQPSHLTLLLMSHDKISPSSCPNSPELSSSRYRRHEVLPTPRSLLTVQSGDQTQLTDSDMSLTSDPMAFELSPRPHARISPVPGETNTSVSTLVGQSEPNEADSDVWDDIDQVILPNERSRITTEAELCARVPASDLSMETSQSSSYLRGLQDRILHPEEHKTYLSRLLYDTWINSSTNIYGAGFTGISMAKRYRNYDLYIRYPDISLESRNVLPEALSDIYITSVCMSVASADQSSASRLHELRGCRNVIVKTWLNLKRLQRSKFCQEFFSIIIIHESRPEVARMERVGVMEILKLARILEHILRKCVNSILYNVQQPSQRQKNLSTHLSLLQPWYDRLLPFEMTPPKITELGFITASQLLVHMLDLAVVGFAGAHVNNFAKTYLEMESKINLLKPYSEDEQLQKQSIVFQPCHLQCLDAFHQGMPIWAFTSNTWQPQKPLYLSTRMQTFADIWGPLWKMQSSQDPSKYDAYIVGNGSVFPWQHHGSDAPSLKGEEVFCHWASDEDLEDFSGSEMISNASTIKFNGTETLLIGAICTAKRELAANSACQTAISNVREHLKDLGRLSPLGATKSYLFNDSTQFQLQVGYSGINGAITRQYKRVPGQSLKDVLIELWAMEPDIRNPELLIDLYGLEVSLCTRNARRVSLSHVLSLKCMRSYLRSFKWEKEDFEAQYFDTLQGSSGPAKILDKNFKENFERAVMLCLRVLGKTGVDRKENLCVFLSSSCTLKPELVTLVSKEHSWIGVLRDTTTDCTMAAFGDHCLEFKHEKGVSCGGTGRSVLRTALVPNLMGTPLGIKTKPSTLKTTRWTETWDISSLKVGKQIWLGDRGTLTLIAHLPDDTLMLGWRSSPVTTAVKYLMSKDQPHREFSEIDQSGRQTTRPIPVFVISHQIGKN